MNFVGASLKKKGGAVANHAGENGAVMNGCLRERKREENVQWTFSAQEARSAVANHAGKMELFMNGCLREG
jgi:hypothetical protein